MGKALFAIFFTIGVSMQAEIKPIRQVEGITEYVLPNGLQFLLFPDSSQSTVTVNLTIKVGSRHEGLGEAGMAHLLEHMLFKGTPTFPDSKGALQTRGAFFNATTWFDRTNYFETLPASDDNLKFALQFEADRMMNSWIRQEDLDSEMTVVRNEFEMGENDPTGVLHDKILASAYEWHNYGKTTIGNRSDIERVPIKKLKAFYQKYYQPDNAVLIVAGKFDADKAINWIQEFFGKIPKPTRVLDKTYTEEPAQDGARYVKLLRTGDVAVVGLAYHIPAGSDPEYAAVRILNDVLTQEPGGYLYQKLVKTGQASEVFGMPYSLAEPGVLMVFSKPVKADQVTKLEKELIQDIEEKQKQAITQESVERAKIKLLKNYKITQSNSKDLALRLSESIAIGDYRLYFWGRDQIKKITLEDVKQAAKKYLVESNRTVGVFVPTKNPVRAQVPATPEVEKMLSNYAGSESLSQGENFEATPENIDKNTHRVTLQNHIKAAFLSKQTRGDLVKASLILHYGSEAKLTGHAEALSLLPALMMRGTKTKSHQEIQDRLDALQSTLQMGASLGKTVLNLTSDKEHIVPLIALVAEILKTPALSGPEFEIVCKKELAELEETLQDPKTLGFNELDRLQNPWPKDNIRYVSTPKERIEHIRALKLEELKKLYQDFYGASYLEIALVGSFDEKAVQNEINKQLGNWKSKQPYTRIKNIYKPVQSTLKVIETDDKQMALLALGTNLELQDNVTAYPAMRIGAYILGESMKSRIWNRLREQGGLSYGAGSWLDVSKYEPFGHLGLFAMAATSNADKALKALEEEYEKWMKEGVTQEELEESKQSFRSTVNNLLANDAYVVNTLGSYLEIERTFDFQAQLLKNIDKLSVQDIQKALNHYVGPMQLVQIKAGDFKSPK